VVALGFYWVRERLASFFPFFDQRLHGPKGFQKTRSRDLSIPAALEELSTIDYPVSANVTAEAPVWDAVAV
jgi:hypothetical protein